jgi:hypothetical protein
MQVKNIWNTFPGSEIQKWRCSDYNRINLTILQKTFNTQNVSIVQHRISRNSKNEAYREPNGKTA